MDGSKSAAERHLFLALLESAGLFSQGKGRSSGGACPPRVSAAGKVLESGLWSVTPRPPVWISVSALS